MTETTVEAQPVQPGAGVSIQPHDANDETDGHQAVLDDGAEITVTVTSADGSREKTYRVALGGAAEEPWPHCLRGDIAVGFTLVVYEGGALNELASCAESRHVVALYALHESVYVSYILGAPDFVNAGFRELYRDGVPAFTPLVAGSNGPPSEDPVPAGAVSLPGPECLRGEIVEGFSLVLYKGGSVGDLNACAGSRGVAAVYALHGGAYVSYILGAPEFVNSAFAELFAEGVPPITPLIVRSEGPPRSQLTSRLWASSRAAGGIGGQDRVVTGGSCAGCSLRARAGIQPAWVSTRTGVGATGAIPSSLHPSRYTLIEHRNSRLRPSTAVASASATG